MTTRKTITKGNLTATIDLNGEGSFYVLATRDGDCLPGIGGKHYTTEKRAITGANRMLAKAS